MTLTTDTNEWLRKEDAKIRRCESCDRLTYRTRRCRRCRRHPSDAEIRSAVLMILEDLAILQEQQPGTPSEAWDAWARTHDALIHRCEHCPTLLYAGYELCRTCRTQHQRR